MSSGDFFVEILNELVHFIDLVAAVILFWFLLPENVLIGQIGPKVQTIHQNVCTLQITWTMVKFDLDWEHFFWSD